MDKKYRDGLHPLQKLFYEGALIILLFSAFLVGYFYYLLFYPIPTITINKNPAKILTKVIHPGDTIVYQLDFCKHTNLEATVTRSIIDHSVVLLPNTTSEFPKGCRVVNFSVQTPLGMSPGTYYIVSTFKYQVNSLHEIDATFLTEKFTVQ